MAIKGKVAGTVQALKRAMKSGGNAEYLLRVGADSEIEVRFLTEPDQWFTYEEHYHPEHKFFPCDDSECLGCEEGLRTSKKTAMVVLDVADNNKVRVMSVPGSVVDQLLKRYDRYSTMLDRNYIIMREGSTQENTSYDVDSNPPSKLNVSKYVKDGLPNIEEMLAAQIPSRDDDDDEDFLPPRRGKKPSGKGKGLKSSSRRRVVDDLEDDILPTIPRQRDGKKLSAKKVLKKRRLG